MAMVVIKHRGTLDRTIKFLDNAKTSDFRRILSKFGEEGVQALSAATPKDSGSTASSWGWDIKVNRGSVTLFWTNSNINKGIPIAILIQYDHGTRTGGYVKGVDYINPTLRPIFDRILDEAWREVTKG